MDEQQVRALVRQAIARHLGPAAAPAGPPQVVAAGPPAAAVMPLPVAPDAGISHLRFNLARPPGEVECLIEPTVTCNHCGYCQCYGH
jgi:hypothetical protein